MRIHNVRYGFACNSSSSHSIIIPFGETKLQDTPSSYGNYGWGHFTCASETEKRRYMAAQLAGSFPYNSPNALRKAIIKDWLGLEFSTSAELPEVDHQSRMDFPYTYDGDFLDKEFFQEFANYIISNNVAILGGNDNDSESHPDRNCGQNVPFPLSRDGTQSVLRCRKDRDVSSGKDYWSIFNRINGTKIRMSFDVPPNEMRHERAEY